MALFLLAALVAACTALSYCEFAALYPSSGEGYRYARETLSERPTWLVGFALLLGYCSSCAFYLASFSEYVERFLYALPWGGGAGATALLLLILLLTLLYVLLCLLLLLLRWCLLSMT